MSRDNFVIDRQTLRALIGPMADPGRLVGLEAEVLDHLPVNLRPLAAFRIAQAGLPETGRSGSGRTILRAATVAWMRRRSAIRTLTSTLEQAGLEAILLKGAALAMDVYPEPALRTMQDIDLWMQPDRLDPAVRALEAVGFRCPDRVVTGVPDSRVPTRILEWPSSPILVELHGVPFSLSGLPGTVRDAMWRRRVPVNGEIRASLLRRDDLLLHLCLHAVRHHRLNGGLGALADVGWVVARGLDRPWSEWVDGVHTARAATSVWLVLHLARRWVGAPIPDQVLAHLTPAEHADRLLVLADRQLAAPGQEFRSAVERLLSDDAVSLARWVGGRFIAAPWRTADRTGTGTGPRVIRGARLMLTDAAVKVGQYLRPRSRGGHVSLLQRFRLARERGRLSRLLERMDRRATASSTKPPG